MQREVGPFELRRHLRQPPGHRRARRSTRTGTAPTASTPTSRSRRTSASRRSSPAPTRPRTGSTGPKGSDYSGRAFYNFTNNLWQVSGGYSQVGENFNPEVGFLPRRGYRRPEFRAFFSAAAEAHGRGSAASRRTSPTTSFYGFDGDLQTETWHIHPFEIQPKQGGRFGWFFDVQQGQPDGAVRGVQPRRPPRRRFRPGSTRGAARVRVPAQSERPRHRHDPLLASATTTTATSTASRSTSDYRITPKATASARLDAPGHRPAVRAASSTTWCRSRRNYSFTTLANLSALLQYNGQTGAVLVERPPRAAQPQRHRAVRGLQRSPRHCSASTALETLGRSFVVKYTRLVDF